MEDSIGGIGVVGEGVKEAFCTGVRRSYYIGRLLLCLVSVFRLSSSLVPFCCIAIGRWNIHGKEIVLFIRYGHY